MSEALRKIAQKRPPPPKSSEDDSDDADYHPDDNNEDEDESGVGMVTTVMAKWRAHNRQKEKQEWDG